MVRNIVNNNVVALQKQFYTFVILLVLSTHSVYATIHSYGIIEESTGRVEIMPEGSVLWHSASNGMRLNHNDRIRTFSDSGCRLFFLDSSFITLGPSTGLLYNNSIHEDAEVVERIFSNMDGQFELSFSQYSIKGESHNWLKIKGLEVQVQSSRLTIQATDSLVTLEVLTESVWTKGPSLKETLTLRDQKILFKPSSGTGSVQTLYRVPPVIPEVEERVVQGVADKLVDLSKQYLVMTAIHSERDSLKNVGRWQLVSALETYIRKALEPHMEKVVFYGTEVNHPVELPDQYKQGTLMLKGELKYFRIIELPTEVRLVCSAVFHLIDIESGYTALEIPFERTFSASPSKENNMKLLKILPLDMKNHKMAKSILKEFFDGVATEIVVKIKDPLE